LKDVLGCGPVGWLLVQAGTHHVTHGLWAFLRNLHKHTLLSKPHLQLAVVHVHPFSDEGKPTACPSQPGGPVHDLKTITM